MQELNHQPKLPTNHTYYESIDNLYMPTDLGVYTDTYLGSRYKDTCKYIHTPTPYFAARTMPRCMYIGIRHRALPGLLHDVGKGPWAPNFLPELSIEYQLTYYCTK